MGYTSIHTPEIATHAERLGWTAEWNSQSGWRFEKETDEGERHIWAVAFGWQCADLIDGRYRNHRTPMWGPSRSLVDLLENA